MSEEPAEYDLVMPFVVCQSNGGPYEDQAFTAGYHAGTINSALAVGAIIGAEEFNFTVRTELVPQLDLIGMRHGYPTLVAKQVEADDDAGIPAMPEWTYARFVRSAL